MDRESYGKMNSRLLISFASWEDRFRLGFDKNLRRFRLNRALVFYFSSYADRTQPNRSAVAKMCVEAGIDGSEQLLHHNHPAMTWRVVFDLLVQLANEVDHVIIDISTMPRDIIWYVLRFVDSVESLECELIYYQPQKYSSDWLSRDPQMPRLVYKLSGVASPGLRTALLVTAGFDVQRVRRLVEWCEPSRVLIGCQSASRFEQNREKVLEYRKEVAHRSWYSLFEFNAYSRDLGIPHILSELRSVGDSYNVILSSLGPKPTALALYKIQRGSPQCALAYAPSRQFNESYSQGIGRSFLYSL